MNCHRDKNVNPLVPVGKSYPLDLEDKDIENIKNTLQNLVSELGIKSGAMNVELVVDKNNKVFPIDVGPRAGGNMIPDLLGIIFNADVVEMAIKVAMGIDIETKPYVGKQYYATYNIHSSVNGFYKEIGSVIKLLNITKPIPIDEKTNNNLMDCFTLRKTDCFTSKPFYSSSQCQMITFYLLCVSLAGY